MAKKKAEKPTAPAAPALSATDIISALFGGVTNSNDARLALYEMLKTPLPGEKFSYGDDPNGTGFHANSIGAVLGGLLGPGPTGDGRQNPFIKQLEMQSLVNNGMQPTNGLNGYKAPGAAPGAVAPGPMGSPVPTGTGTMGTSGKPVVTPKPIAIKPAPKMTTNKITTQTATPTAAPVEQINTTGENGGFKAADSFAVNA